MNWIFLLIIFLATLGGGIIPMVVRKVHPNLPIYLLAFTGACLFGITIMHLLPEVFHELGNSAGIYIVIGFFVQVALQQLSHGTEHGHTHVPTDHHHHVPIAPLLLGLSIHAFMEGIPLGFNFNDNVAMPSLVIGIAAHKLPEALTLMTVMIHSHHRGTKLWRILLIFSLVTPLAAILAAELGSHSAYMTHIITYVVALVIGAFLHISTTIFYESGTKHHELSYRKVIAISAGLLLAFLTLIFE
ncbi:Zinc transporter ZupT [Chitinophaga sp. CF118]|uniref:ZIP family metal transporter n=1 Tax=Chitinophaga sp. CF118 TaxID=1884367 RepID=UPI0008EAF491|nr:ZIP family metal transporter [Chitinophaga sp. CF118]SFE15209.1 Zinc transporter ZupT [Chitinophaga sp. CF118]